MKFSINKLNLAIPLLLVSLTVVAHEGEDHTEEAQELDCSTMAGTDHPATDVKDPVMQAMMMKCQAQLADVAAGDAHAHEENGHADATVVGAVAEHGHIDGADDHGHGDHQ